MEAKKFEVYLTAAECGPAVIAGHTAEVTNGALVIYAVGEVRACFAPGQWSYYKVISSGN